MKRPLIPAAARRCHSLFTPLAAFACAGLLSGCSGGELRGIRSIGVDGNVTNKHRVEYSDRLTNNMTQLGVGTILPAIVLMGVNAGISAGPKHQIEAAMHGIPIEKIVADACTTAISQSGVFTLGTPGAADATLRIEIKSYGIAQSGSSDFRRSQAVVIQMQARLVKGGRTLFDRPMQGSAVGAAEVDAYAANPTLLRTHLQQAATAGAAAIVAQIAREGGQTAAPAATSPPARRIALATH